MPSDEKRIKVYVTVDQGFAARVIEALREIGVHEVHVETGRSLQLAPTRGLRRLLSGTQPIDEEPINVFSFLVSAKVERSTVSHLTERLRLDAPGRGSIYTKEIALIAANDDFRDNDVRVPAASAKLPATKLMGISCIVQKGNGNAVAMLGLTTGTAIPAITFGIGTGLRNRLGAWRILIPADKEIATIAVAAEDAETVMEMMVEVGQLDEPGKGFIYVYPLSLGILNTKFHIGTVSQAASIEQIVSAIDEIKGTTEWRRKFLAHSVEATRKRRALTGLVDFSVVCNEGSAETMTKIAMDAGAPGATIRRLKYLSLDERVSRISPAREISVMTIAENQARTIAQSLADGGLLGPEACGEIHVNPVPKACTYLGR